MQHPPALQKLLAEANSASQPAPSPAPRPPASPLVTPLPMAQPRTGSTGGTPPPPVSGGGGGSGFGGWFAKNRFLTLVLALLVISFFGLFMNNLLLEYSLKHLERVEKIEANRQAREAVKRQPQLNSPIFSAGTCVSPHPGQTTFEKPVTVAVGGCINLPAASVHGMYFWAIFKGAPSNMSGVTEVRRARFTGTLVPDGTRDVEPLDGCTGESCASFISNHLGEVLFVRQSVGKQLEIKL